MIGSLYRLAMRRAAELTQYEIRIDANAGVIIYQDRVIRFSPYTATSTCEKALNEIIRQAKDDQAAKLLENQATLLLEEES